MVGQQQTMKKFLIVFVVVVALAAGYLLVYTLTRSQDPFEIEAIADPKCTWADRRSMIDKLASSDPYIVLEPTGRAVILSEPMFKSGSGYNNDDWIAANVPPSRQPHLAYMFAWKMLVERKSARTASAVRALALSKADPKIRKMATIGLIYHESPETLAALRTLSRDTEAKVRRSAVLGLSKYLPATKDDLIAMAKGDQSADCRHDALLRLLWDYDAPPAEWRPNGTIVSLAVAAIRTDPEKGYYLVGGLENFSGINFTPDSNDPRYSNEHGINDLFMRTTIKNVLSWHDLGQIHYELTKEQIIARLGKPDEDHRYTILNEGMLQAALRQADSTTDPLRSAKIGDRIEECQWVQRRMVLVIKFLNDAAKPALIRIYEADI